MSTAPHPQPSGPVVVALAGVPDSERLIRAASAQARASGADLIAVHVRGPGTTEPDGGDEHRRLLGELGGSYIGIADADVAGAVAAVVESADASAVVVGRSARRWLGFGSPSAVDDIARAVTVPVHVVDAAGPPAATRYRPPPLDRRRVVTGWLLAVLGVPALTAALVPVRDVHGVPDALLVYVLLLVAVAVTGGAGPAAAAAVGSFLAVNWFLTPPFHTLVVGTSSNLLALVTFLVVGAVISSLVGQVARRSAEAARARADAEALARAAGRLAGGGDPLAGLIEQIRTTFDLDGVAVLADRGDGDWRSVARAGAPLLAPADATTTIAIGDATVLAVRGQELSADDRRVLTALAAQLATALERRRLQAEAADAAVLAETDALRTALLRAVSHDLRTPLASIKASVSSLRQHDVDWTPEETAEFLAMIEEETDRLNRVIGNLLDMSRLQAGALTVKQQPVALEDVVPAAVQALPAAAGCEMAVDERSPRVLADAALLERALANVISNAVAWNEGAPVRVEAIRHDGVVDICVVDHGPGVASGDRARMFEPFQRRGDRSSDTGVGLGLAVTRGFMEAMDGAVTMTDTPGGGLTVVLTLPAAGR